MSKTKIGPNEREDAKRSQWRNRHKSWLVDWIYYIFHYLNDVDVKGNWIHIDSFKKNLSVGMTVINHDRCLRLDCSIFFWFHLSRLSASIYSNTKWIRFPIMKLRRISLPVKLKSNRCRSQQTWYCEDQTISLTLPTSEWCKPHTS